MFCVINITTTPPTIVEGTESENIQDCLDWISINGNAVIYSIEEI